MIPEHRIAAVMRDTRMSYSERAFFTTDACAHCAARDEHLRLERIWREQIRARARREWDALPDARPWRIQDHIEHARQLRPSK